MRTDVKLGVISSAVIVFVTGGYYVFRNRGEQAIPVADKPAEVAANQPPAVTPADKTGRTMAADPTANGRRAAQPNRSRSQRPANTSPATPRTGISSSGAATPNEAVAANTKPETGAADRPQVPGSNEMAGGPARPGNPAARTAMTPPRSEPATLTAQPNANNPISPPAITGSTNPATTPSPVMTGGPATGATNQQLPAGAGTNPSSNPMADTSTRPASSPAIPADANAVRNAGVSTPPENRDAAVEMHRVQPGDSLASLARSYYGQERLATFLARSNPQITDPRNLTVGQTVRIPPAPSADAANDHSSPSSTKVVEATEVKRGVPLTAQSSPAKPGKASRTHKVRKGDTFYDIARDVLGDAGRWKEVFELNRASVGGDPNKLKVGQEIVLPDK